MSGSEGQGQEHRPGHDGRRRKPRWRLFVLVPVILGLVAELAAFLLASVGEGKLCGYGCHELRKDRVLAGDRSAAWEVEVGSEARPIWLEKLLEDQAVHPFLGFVDNPDSFRRVMPGSVDEEAKRFGLMGNVHGLFHEPRRDRLIVAVLGGSVARQISDNGRVQLESALARAPRFAGREVRVITLAIGGYKAPQPLMSLSYLLSLGFHADVVILIDGLNDIALAGKDNVPYGVHPSYPRSWHLRVAHLEDELAMLRGETRFINRQRRRLARAAKSPPWSLSMVANAAWGTVDRRLELWLDIRIEELTTRIPLDRSFATHGPDFETPTAEALAQDSAALWEQSSLQLQALSEGFGFEYHHVLQPNQYDGRKPLLDYERGRAFLESSPFKESVELAYPRLRERGEALRRRGVSFHDLTGVFEGIREPLYVDSCCHVNHRGNEILVEAIARSVGDSPPPSARP